MSVEYDKVFAKLRELEKTLPEGKWKHDEQGYNQLKNFSSYLISIIAELYRQGQQGYVKLSDIPEESKDWIKKQIDKFTAELR